MRGRVGVGGTPAPADGCLFARGAGRSWRHNRHRCPKARHHRTDRHAPALYVGTKGSIVSKPTLQRSGEKLAASAEKIKDSTYRVEDSAERTTQLAADRTVFAAERTY